MAFTSPIINPRASTEPPKGLPEVSMTTICGGTSTVIALSTLIAFTISLSALFFGRPVWLYKFSGVLNRSACYFFATMGGVIVSISVVLWFYSVELPFQPLWLVLFGALSYIAGCGFYRANAATLRASSTSTIGGWRVHALAVVLAVFAAVLVLTTWNAACGELVNYFRGLQ